jgi:Zn-dependent protease
VSSTGSAGPGSTYHGGVPATDSSLRIAGIPVHVPLSGVLGVLLLAFVWAPTFDGSPDAPGWVLALVFAALFAVAILVHEFSHALTARALGYSVQHVILHFLGGVTQFDRTRSSAWREAVVAAAGPAATFAVAAMCALVAGALPEGSSGQAVASALLWGNLVMGVYNSLPGLPLDGGNVVRCLVWGLTGSERRGTLVAAWIGRGVAVLTLLVPAYLILTGSASSSDLLVIVLFAMVAAMLWAGANANLQAATVRERAVGISAVGLARRAMPVDRDLPLAEAIRRATAAGAGALVVTDHDGVPTGIGQHDAIAAVPEQRRPWVSVGTVATPLDATAVIPRDLSGEDLLGELGRRGRRELLVVDERGLVFGVLVLADVDAALRA